MYKNKNKSKVEKIKESGMTKLCKKNEIVKRQFQKYCRNSKGYSEKSIGYYMNSVFEYEKFSAYEDFAKFNDDKAIAFREFLKKKTFKGKTVELSTVKDKLRYLKIFFSWLSDQAGYKKAIKKEDVECLRLSREDNARAEKPQREEYPSFDMIQKVVNNMKVTTEDDMRDRAMIAFTLLSGGRDDAIISLPLDCFKPNNLEISYFVNKGVRTKFRKSYTSFLYKFDSKLIAYVTDWYDYLTKVKLYPNNAPLFPRTAIGQQKGNKSFTNLGIEPEFWKTIKPIENIFKKRFEEVGLKYYPPHSFRHTADNLLKRACHNIEEFQAVSQNFGHESMATTFSSYGKLPIGRVEELIRNLDFSENKATIPSPEMMTDLVNLVKKYSNNKEI